MQAEKKAVLTLDQGMQYKSDHPLLIEMSLRELSRHFEGLFSTMQTATANSQEKMANFDQMVESLLGVLKNQDVETEQVMILYLSMQFFKITQLSNSKNKAREMLTVISRCYRFMGFASTRVEFRDPNQVARCVIEGEYRQVIDYLGTLSGRANSSLNNKIISLLREKMKVVSELTNFSKHNTVSSDEFHYQKDEANRLIPECSEESDENIRELYGKILNILAGNFKSISDACESPIQLIKAYLLYIDPEMSDQSSFEQLYSSDCCHKSQNIQFLFIMIGKNNDPYICLEFCAKVFPIFVYHSLYLYTCFMVHSTKEMREQDVIADILRDMSTHAVDFFTAKPYISRLAAMDYLNQETVSDIGQICLATIDPSRNSSKPGLKRSIIDLILSYLKQNQYLQTIVPTVVEAVIENEKVVGTGIEDILPLVINDASLGSITGLICPTDDNCAKMMSPSFKVSDRASDQKTVDSLRKVVHEMSSKSQVSPILAFINAYIEMRDHVDELKALKDPNEIYQTSRLGKLFADMAKEFGNQPNLFKMIFVPLLAYRSLFRGTLRDINELLHCNLSMKTQVEYLISRSADGSREARSYGVLSECIKRANILLNAFRANCSY